MTTPLPLPRLTAERTPHTFYRTSKYLRYWDGVQLLCEHKARPGSCKQCRPVEMVGVNTIQPLPRLIADRVANTFYRTPKYLRYWDGVELLCEHKARPSGCKQCQPPAESGRVVAGHYLLGGLLGEGSFGRVFAAVDQRSTTRVAVKVEAKTRGRSYLEREVEVYRALGVQVELHTTKTDTYLAMPLIQGVNLHDLRRSKPERSVVLALAPKLLREVERLHALGFVHNDIKPANFILDSTRIHLIDFGLSKKVQSRGQYGRGIDGTYRYISPNIHAGMNGSYRDDLISLFYSLVILLGGTLPWRGIIDHKNKARLERVHRLKVETSVEELCAGLPSGYKRFIQHCQELGFDQRPDYELLHQALKP